MRAQLLRGEGPLLLWSCLPLGYQLPQLRSHLLTQAADFGEPFKPSVESRSAIEVPEARSLHHEHPRAVPRGRTDQCKLGIYREGRDCH